MNELLAHSVHQVENARRENHLGRDFLVVPVVALRPMVLNCVNCISGGEYVAEEEIALSLPGWEGRPITLGHPKNGAGTLISANTKMAAETVHVGKFYNIKFKDGKLKGEIWLDIAAASKTEEGQKALERFEEGKPTEVSTSYFARRIREHGFFEDTRYSARQVGLIPDHLAILVNEKGACSLEDGCGAPRTNTHKKEEGKEEDPVKKNGKTYREKFMAVLEGALELGALSGNHQEEEDDIVDRKELIKKLRGNEIVGNTFSEQELEAFSDEKLKGLAKMAGVCDDCGKQPAANADKKDEAKGEGAEEKVTKPTPAANEGGAPKPEEKKDDSTPKGGDPSTQDGITADELAFIRELRKEHGSIQTVLNSAKEEATRREAEKTKLVTELTGNKRCAIAEKELKGMSLEALQGLKRTLEPASFAGAGGPRRFDNSGDEDDAPPAPPQIVLAKAEDTTKNKES